jgi:uncharacterized membrane protein HdeD (DUF308 family)
MATLHAFMLGAFAMASAVASLFFLRFWQQTRDRFFLFFAISFLIAAVDRIAVALSHPPAEREPLFYLVRLLTHALIIAAIVDKNRAR